MCWQAKSGPVLSARARELRTGEFNEEQKLKGLARVGAAAGEHSVDRAEQGPKPARRAAAVEPPRHEVAQAVAPGQKACYAAGPLANGVYHKPPAEAKRVARGDFERRGWDAAKHPNHLNATGLEQEVRAVK